MRKKIADDQLQEVFNMYMMGYKRQEIANKFGVTPSYISQLITKNNWRDRKLHIETKQYDEIELKYVNASEDILNRVFIDTYKMLGLWEEAFSDKRTMMDRAGILSHFKMEKAITNLQTIKQMLDDMTGVIPTKDIYELKLKYENLKVKKELSGLTIGDDVEPVDNFKDIVAESIKLAQQEEETDNED